jgi:uncharacterized SAM-binding protein YcdF (DUF218 family)
MNSVGMPKDKKIVKAAEILWDYMKMDHIVSPVDIIFVLASLDDRVASYTAELYKREISKQILISGGAAHSDDILATKWGVTEAEHFAKIMIEHGIPARSIILETKAMNTGDNILLGYKKLAIRRLVPQSILLIHKPYMERRTYAAFMKQWPGNKERMIVSSPDISFIEYFNDDQPFDKTINIMVGDLQRIAEYPEFGYQTYQKIPDSVRAAYNYLAENKFNKRLIQH